MIKGLESKIDIKK